MGGRPKGEVETDTFDLVKLYLQEGRQRKGIVGELVENGFPFNTAIAIVINAELCIAK